MEEAYSPAFLKISHSLESTVFISFILFIFSKWIVGRKDVFQDAGVMEQVLGHNFKNLHIAIYTEHSILEYQLLCHISDN